MAEAARLIGMLQASAAQQRSSQGGYANHDQYRGYGTYDKNFTYGTYGKPADCGGFPAFSSFSVSVPVPATKQPAPVKAIPAKREAIPVSFVEALQQVANGQPLPPQPSSPFSQDFKVGLNKVLSTLNAIFPAGGPLPAPAPQVKETTSDIANDLAVVNSKRIFQAARKGPVHLEVIANDLHLKISDSKIDKMAGRFPALTTSNLPPATPQEKSATASPARGSAMLNSIFKSVRVPEFRHKWQFWAEKGVQPGSSSKSSAAEDYANRPKPLGEPIVSVKDFYQHFNNIPLEGLKMRDAIHLFHAGVKPVWEDPRNSRGGSYYFRVPKELAPQFWHEICLLAVGDVLQAAVETKRECKFTIIYPTDLRQLTITQRSTTISVGSPTACAGTRFRSSSGPATPTTRRARSAYWLQSWTRSARS